MEEQALKYWLALWRVPGLGPKTFLSLLSRYPRLSTFFEHVAKKNAILHPLNTEVLSACQAPDWAGVERDLSWLNQASNHHIITHQDSSYPPALKAIYAPPPLLFVAGDLSVLRQDQMAIVGSRKASVVGQETARHFASQLVHHGWVVTSGLALGIDAAAHRGALRAGGRTVAVLGTGIDLVYPRMHKGLTESCKESGAIVSEWGCGAGPRAQHFPRRNRVVSGLSKGVLVVEARQRSGSLITAKHALDQGRDVFAVPGSIYSEQAHGCLELIQSGAKCVREVSDVLEEYAAYDPVIAPLQANQSQCAASLPKASRVAAKKPEDPLQRQILSTLSHDPMSLDTLLEAVSDVTGKALAAIQHLQIEGFIVREVSGYRLMPQRL